ncbi:tetratricopeptide repeat protein [Pelotalea chapellei]|uniref:Tetratricopeptide repeat protein n=1 Tax=Pelotalea chapellei TaxID=44671 RepID=A0ABS5UAM1_9BACT|nr:tetratricopeptide repeat protein [Pelotalea chapellei]MBT1072731.1 tetratricopeptide repeat protein [Pelotalea chapellei]
MADSFDSNNDPFAAFGVDTSSQRAQMAQYALMQAANYMQNKKNDQAIASFKKALVMDPQNTTAYTYIGKIYQSQGKNSEAIKAFKEVVRIQSNPYVSDNSSNATSLVDAHINLGNAYLQDKQYAASEKEFKTAAKLDPTNPLPVYTLGLQYSNTDRLAEAETQFLKVKKISPRDGNVYYALGMLYNKQGRYDEAVDNIQKALTLKKKFPAANYELGVAYDGLGKTDDAKQQLSILKSSTDAGAYTYYQNLKTLLNKPGMIALDTKNSGGFSGLLGPNVPLWMLDPTMLTQPQSGRTFSIKISFNAAMDVSSVTNTQNWTISRANSVKGGYYNNTLPASAKEAALPPNPEMVVYDAVNHEATVIFRLNQNSAGNAVIDQSHVVFKFSGKDALGRVMDKTADEVDGFSVTPF